MGLGFRRITSSFTTTHPLLSPLKVLKIQISYSTSCRELKVSSTLFPPSCDLLRKSAVGTPKYLANKMKSKGLQRLRWYCQVCEKQCRDDNGFKCHIQSEAHLRQMLVVGENAGRHIADYSGQFQHDFVQLLSRRYVHLALLSPRCISFLRQIWYETRQGKQRVPRIHSRQAPPTHELYAMGHVDRVREAPGENWSCTS